MQRVLEQNSALVYKYASNVPVGEIDFKQQDEVLENLQLSLKRESETSNIDVSIDFKADSNSFLIELSDIDFVFEGKGSESSDSYKLEGAVSTLKGHIKVDKEEVSKYLVIPDFIIKDVHIEIDSFLSLT